MASLLEILRITGSSYAWPHSDREVEVLLLRHYGAQITGSFLAFEDTVYGVLSTFHPARLLQLNRFVTAGLTPSGDVNGYQLSFKRKTQAAMNTNITEGTALYADRTEHQPIRSVINAASVLALDIRTNQYFKDGNHRTCLLALILYLAEHGVVLTSSFHVYRAYTIVSARFHPGNESNTINAAARADAHQRIVKYLRRRTVRGVADSEYLRTLADTVRQLPIIVSHVEEIGVRLRREWKHKSQIWSTLNWAQKVVVKWTFPDLNKGRNKI
ncbi:hypothetical protein MVEN_01930400 [Mycena venus]|uniref:Fido domain-containing protein n=1 Tax=Mycena venus TaxID=2733690 RepID=A0A8H7CJS3_9AGAR|nr:hypothetical protein MVEN_01930400 [Mycena venus]